MTTLLNLLAASQSLLGPCAVKHRWREECGRWQNTSLEDASVVWDVALLVRAGELCSVLILLLKFERKPPVALKKWSRPGSEGLWPQDSWDCPVNSFCLLLQPIQLEHYEMEVPSDDSALPIWSLWVWGPSLLFPNHPANYILGVHHWPHEVRESICRWL